MKGLHLRMRGAGDEKLVLLYDGSCRFCIASSERLERWARPGAVRRVALQDDRGIAELPARPETGEAMTLQLMHADGRIDRGAAATFGVLATRPAWRLVTWMYGVPGLRQIIDWEYALIARHRYKIMGRAGGGSCDTDACKRA